MMCSCRLARDMSQVMAFISKLHAQHTVAAVFYFGFPLRCSVFFRIWYPCLFFSHMRPSRGRPRPNWDNHSKEW